MTEQTDAAEVAALAKFWHEFWTRGGGCMGHHFADEEPQCIYFAKVVLASDWLAAREAAARAEALREAAGEWGGTEQVRLETVGKWLRARAARLTE